ncbi:MAG: VOC family protein [Candidatus Hodarchaeales archaeon]|jgi:predicted enzyme related to lactoylglutathione lyase
MPRRKKKATKKATKAKKSIKKKTIKAVKAKKPTKKKKALKKKAVVQPINQFFSSDSVYCVVNVGDINRAKEFYINTLELKPALPDDFPATEVGWFEFHLPVTGSRLGLNLVRKGEIPKSTSLGIVVTDLDKVFSLLKDKNAKPTDIQDIPDMVSTFEINDTEGNEITLIGNPRVKSN